MKDNRIREVLRLIPENKVVLDIGCAQNPEIHFEIAEKSKKAVGIDISKQGLEVFKKRGLEVYEMSAEEIKLKDKFDCIVAGELIEHLSNPGLFLSGMEKHLNKNGRIILTTPNIASLFIYILVVAFDQTQDPTHTFYFDKKNLEVLIDRYNLRITHVQYIPPKIKILGNRMTFKVLFFIATLFANIGYLLNNRLFGSYLLTVLEKK
ncbi:methyltransferase domain-containing protein [Candidatus Roizmanbacteria bacterium]|nr:methyltransferase domain-containing protein [Candidatus Roizmanbacteria bacterium]